MTAFLWSIGTALPEFDIDQSDAAKVVQEIGISERWRDALPALYRKSGVRRRGSVLLNRGGEGTENRQSFYPVASLENPFGPSTSERMQVYAKCAGPLLETACRNALDPLHLEPQKITHLVTVSCTGFFSPGVDHQLIERLGLSREVQRTHVGFMGCHGMINGMRTATAIVSADSNALVLVGAVELCSLHQQYSEDPQQLVANALFADGAASAVVGGDRATFGEESTGWTIQSSRSCMIPESMSHMAWCIGDHGFLMKLSPEVPKIIGEHLRKPIQQWLSEQGLELDAIHAWAIHPGGPRILDAVEKALDLTPEQMQGSRTVLAEHGNMSSPTVLFILDRVSKHYPQAEHAILLAFGPGLHAEMILLNRMAR